jgi:hypothetical protein
MFQIHPPPKKSLTAQEQKNALLEEQMDSIIVPDDTTNPDARSVSPWLLTTHWHEHVQGYSVEELLKLISLPREEEFPGLRGALLLYLQEAQDLMPQISELVLQRINTSNPAKTCVNLLVLTVNYTLTICLL